jgi:biopolymer transport protein ExbD
MTAFDTLPPGDPGPRKARVEIIPLIDVIFFLLATFVLFTLSLQRIAVLETNFAHAGVPQRDSSESGVTILAAADGTYLWTQGTDSAEGITAAELGPRLAQYRRSVPEPRVMVRGEGRAKLGAVVTLLDEVRGAGIRQVAVETLPGRAPR